MSNAGYSTCPICMRYWEVVMFDDCCLPACGCYGNDTSANNPLRPCESCGIIHALDCLEIEEELGDE